VTEGNRYANYSGGNGEISSVIGSEDRHGHISFLTFGNAKVKREEGGGKGEGQEEKRRGALHFVPARRKSSIVARGIETSSMGRPKRLTERVGKDERGRRYAEKKRKKLRDNRPESKGILNCNPKTGGGGSVVREGKVKKSSIIAARQDEQKGGKKREDGRGKLLSDGAADTEVGSS